MRGFVGLGGNRGARLAHLERGIRACRAAGWALNAVSSVWESPPAEGAAGGPFLNAVAEFDGPPTPEAWLATLQAAERAEGRRRIAPGESRTLDLDLLWIDGVERSSPELTVPHPRARMRPFVVFPWAEIAPELRPFRENGSLAECARNLRRAGGGALRRFELRLDALRPHAVAPAGKPPL